MPGATSAATAISPHDLERLRADTPACRELAHFNNAGASLMPQPVYDAVTGHLALECAIGGYEAAARAAPALGRFYTGLAELLGARPGEIAYAENATRAWDMAFYALPLADGDEIITHAAEYASNYLAFLQLQRRRGVQVVVAPSDTSGQLDVDALPSLIGSRTKLIAITHVPSQGGLVNPVEAVGAIARNHGITYLLDACQSVGQLDVDVGRIGCHLLSGTGRKFLRGPRGTGFLYVSTDVLADMDPPFIDLRAAEWTGQTTFELAPGARRFETWESNVAGRVGLAAAVDYARGIGLAAIEARVSELAASLRAKLAAIEGVAVRDLGARKSGIVTFTSAAEPPEQLAIRLRGHRVNISVTGRSTAQLDLGARGLDQVARASVHYYNTEAEIDRLCDLVAAS